MQLRCIGTQLDTLIEQNRCAQSPASRTVESSGPPAHGTTITTTQAPSPVERDTGQMYECAGRGQSFSTLTTFLLSMSSTLRAVLAIKFAARTLV